MVTNNLDWKLHIIKWFAKLTVFRAWSGTLAMMWKIPLTRKILYLAPVRPILEYGSEIWNLSTKGLITSIERVQRRATRFILRSSAPMKSVKKNSTFLVLRTGFTSNWHVLFHYKIEWISVALSPFLQDLLTHLQLSQISVIPIFSSRHSLTVCITPVMISLLTLGMFKSFNVLNLSFLTT